MVDGRWEDLAPVDLEGWLADQGRNFLASTDQRISRLGLPDFMRTSQQKIQGLGQQVGQIYSGIEDTLQQTQQLAQQRAQDFMASTDQRIQGLGQDMGSLGQQAGQGFSDLGTTVRGGFDRAGAMHEDLQEGLTGLRQATLPDITRAARSGLDWAEERLPADDSRGRVSPVGGSPGQQRRALRTGIGSLRTALDRLDETSGRLRGGAAEAEAARARGDVGGELGQRAGMLGTAALTGLDVLSQPLRTLGRSYAGGTLPAGGDRNLAGLPADTPVLGGLLNPVEATGELFAAATPATLIESVAGQLVAQGFRAGRPLVERFVREVGDGTVRQALRQGGEALGALFDDFVARVGEGPLGRLAGEEEGGFRIPGFGRRQQTLPPAEPLPYPNPTTPAERAINDQALIRRGQQEAALTPEAPSPIPKGSALETFDRRLAGWRELWTDENARLVDVQKVVEGRLGRKLTPDENVVLQRRLYAGRGPAEEQAIREGIAPAVRGLSPEEVRDLEGVTEHLDVIGRSKAIANQATARAAGEEVGPVAGETELRTTAQSLRMRRARLGEALQQQDAADQAYRDASAELKRVRSEGRREVRGSQGRGRPRTKRTPAEQAQVEADVQARVDAARQATVDARAASKAAARDANVNLSKVTRADLKRMRLEAETEAARIAEEAEIAEGAATAGAEAQAARRYSGGVTGVDYDDDVAWTALEHNVRERLGPNATDAQVQEGVQKIRTAVEQLQAYSRSLRARLRESGVISQDLYEQWEREFPHYIRTNILKFMEEEGATPAAAGAQRFTVGSLVAGGQDLGARMTEEGTHALREQPLNALVRMTQATETLARRNEIAQTLDRLAQLEPEGATKDLAEVFRPLAPGEATKPGEALFSFYRDGEPVRYAVDKRFEGLFNLPTGEARKLAQDIGRFTGANIVRGALTTYNPAFYALNAMRDYLVLLRREAGASPLEAVRATGDVLRAAGGIVAEKVPALQRVVPGARAAAARARADLGEAARLGGSQDQSWARATPREVRDLIAGDPAVRGRARLVQSPKQVVEALGSVLRETGSAVETAPRLAAYRRALRRGADPREAALAMRDVTLDFSRGGRWARNVNAVVPFFNAAIQGSSRFVADDLVNRKGATALQASILLGSKAALDAYNRSYGEEYDDVPDYLKDTGLVLMLPGDVPPEERADGTLVPGGRNFLYYPLPQDMGALLRVGTQAYRRATGTGGAAGLDTAEGKLGMLGDVLTAASPVNLEGGSLLPPAARQVVEQTTNRDLFRDRDLVPEYLMERPPEDQYTPQTSALGRVAGAAGEALGLPISPLRTDYAVTGTLGGTGRQVLNLSDLLARGAGREDLASRPYSAPEEQQALDVARGVPVVGGVVGGVARQSGGQLDANARAVLARRITAAQREERRRLERSPGFRRLSEAQRAEVLREEQDRVRRRLEDEARDEADLAQLRRVRAQR
jgi:conjugative element/phage-associated large polyvalent protein